MVARATALNGRGERPPGTLPSLKAVPLFSQAACESNAAAALVILAILFILSIPLLPFTQLNRSRCRSGAMKLGGLVAVPIWRDEARSSD
jgi:hypothetical protein